MLRSEFSAPYKALSLDSSIIHHISERNQIFSQKIRQPLRSIFSNNKDAEFCNRWCDPHRALIATSWSQSAMTFTYRKQLGTEARWLQPSWGNLGRLFASIPGEISIRKGSNKMDSVQYEGKIEDLSLNIQIISKTETTRELISAITTPERIALISCWLFQSVTTPWRRHQPIRDSRPFLSKAF